MIRALTSLAAIFALVVSAAPVASAGTSKAKPPRFERAERAAAFVWEAELSPVKAAAFGLSIDGHSMLHGASSGSVGFKRRSAAKAPRPAGHGIIAVLIGLNAAVPTPRSVKDGLSNTVMFG